MEYAVIIERELGSESVCAYSPDVDVYVVRDAALSDDDMLVAFKDALSTYVEAMRKDCLPLPEPRHRVAMVQAP